MVEQIILTEEKLFHGELASLAEAQVAKGLPPPPEIYQAPNRDQVDWSVFPLWARPIDPDFFEGCIHEG